MKLTRNILLVFVFMLSWVEAATVLVPRSGGTVVDLGEPLTGVLDGIEMGGGTVDSTLFDSLLGLLPGGNHIFSGEMSDPPPLWSVSSHVFLGGDSYAGSLLLVGEQFSINVYSLQNSLSGIRLLGDDELLHSFSHDPVVESSLSPDGRQTFYKYHFSDSGSFSSGQLDRVSEFSMEVIRPDGFMVQLATIVVPEPSSGVYVLLSAGVFFRRLRK